MRPWPLSWRVRLSTSSAGGVVEVALHLCMQARLVFLDRQQVIGAGFDNGPGDPRIAGDGVDRDQRALDGQTVQKGGDSGRLVRFLIDRLLAQHETFVARPSGDQMQGFLALASVVAPARGLAVDRDQGNARLGALLVRPGREAGSEQVRIDPVHHHPQPILARDAPVVGLKLPQELQPGLAPVRDLIVVVAAGDRGTDHQKQHLRQGIHHLARLARVLDR